MTIFSNTPHCPMCELARCQHLKICPSCRRSIFQFTPAVRGPSSNQAWVCLWCAAILCVYCYADHTRSMRAPTVSLSDG